MIAPRARLFTDIFLGDHLYALVELRADRGEAPRAGLEEARVEQLFARVSNRAGSFSIQAGRFASPFGSYPLRHLTVGDAFVRPPLLYDYPTTMCPGIAPPTTAWFLTWQDEPETFRRIGAPPVCGVPYQWGAMASGVRGALSYRVAVMNSAQSSSPGDWGWDADQMRYPSLVGGLGLQVTPSLHVGVSASRGPWLSELKKGTIPAGWDRWDYAQEIVSADVTYARGPVVVRAEVMRDRWEVPNVPGYPVEWGSTLEFQTDLGAGWSAGLRGGVLDFRPLEDGARSRDWDFDVRRWEASLGYRLRQNVGVLGSWAVTDQRSPIDPDDDLMAVRLWWAF